MKESIKYLLLSMSSILIPILLFGYWDIKNQIIILPLIILFIFLINLKSIEGKSWPVILYSALHGYTMGSYGISFLTKPGLNNPGYTFSPWNSIIFIISFILFSYFSTKCRLKKKREYEIEFQDNPILIDRDKKINKILGNIINT